MVSVKKSNRVSIALGLTMQNRFFRTRFLDILYLGHNTLSLFYTRQWRTCRYSASATEAATTNRWVPLWPDHSAGIGCAWCKAKLPNTYQPTPKQSHRLCTLYTTNAHTDTNTHVADYKSKAHTHTHLPICVCVCLCVHACDTLYTGVHKVQGATRIRCAFAHCTMQSVCVCRMYDIWALNTFSCTKTKHDE